MSSMPWIALYPSDYLADTAHLGLTEHGVYWRLLLHYYQHRSPLPGDLDKLCRIVLANTPEERRTVEYILTEFFVLTISGDGGRVWRHARADKEISGAQVRQEANAARAKAGAAARWKRDEKCHDDASSMLQASVKHSSSNAQAMLTTTTTTSTKSEERERDTPPASRSALPAVKPSRLPDWIDPAAWEGFVAMRKKIRAPLTERAITVTINALERLRAEGQNPNHCLDQSTQHAWRGVFAVKTGDNHAGQRRETPLQASLREAEEILQRARDGTLGPEWDFSNDGDDVFGPVHPPERALPAQGGGGVPGEAARRLTNT